MSILYASLLTFLAMTFVYAGLLLLHGLRKVIGTAAFCIALGLLFVFMELVGAAGFRIVTELPGLNFNLMSPGLLLPFLGAIMVVYITDGTLATQRMMIGMIFSLILYLYLANLAKQLVGAMSEEKAFALSELLTLSLRSMTATVVSFAVDIFLLPILYQWFRNKKCRLVIAMIGALALVQFLDGLLFVIINHLGNNNWWRPLAESYLANMLAVVWIGIMTGIYLSRIDQEEPGTGRRALDILFAFFGNYGKTKALEADLRRSEERYKLLFERAGDMVLVINSEGMILNANRAAHEIAGMTDGKDFQILSGLAPETWQNETPGPVTVVLPGSERVLELTFTPFRAQEEAPPEYIIFGRDITRRTRLEKELEEWRTRTEHNQRLQSIGRLAGGIAHDFNNFLHAIQGHLDIILYMHPVDDENVTRHLQKVEDITDKAATLTRQLLGFARKGTYARTVCDPAELIRSTLELFLPDDSEAAAVQIDASAVPASAGFRINADAMQIQQTLLNILINARDAMKNIPQPDRRITIATGKTTLLPAFQMLPPPEADFNAALEYGVIRISDNGPGISDAIRNRIFEPFFTTKPVGQGTGMGLSMAYGTMLSHKGWLQCGNIADGGAVFELVFPIVSDPKDI
ncbi:MAG: PAS domain S-box protein [Lentisphaeria bacterium]|nr:PAS domain S-box protein [Lentisphaeria bacterium]